MRTGTWIAKAAALIVAVAWLAASPAWSQSSPPPKPKPKPPSSSQDKAPPPKPKVVGPAPVYVPPPVLILSADMDCLVELDGTELVRLTRDAVQEIKIKPGEHLLQAFPIGIENGPTWKQAVKAPDTGTVVATIELRELVAEWEEEMENVDRFSDEGAFIVDHDTGLVWTKSVSPKMRWPDAVGYCSRQRTAGVSGWAMPSLDDLSKLHYPDHPAPRQETGRGEEVRGLLFGSRQGPMQVLPRLIFEPFEHNSVASLWVKGSDERVSCSFLGAFNCRIEKKKHQAAVLCVRPYDGASAGGSAR